eukprot:COSAG05_NODE_687_length_7922_cov_7.188035_7_plen_87_part_00
MIHVSAVNPTPKHCRIADHRKKYVSETRPETSTAGEIGNPFAEVAPQTEDSAGPGVGAHQGLGDHALLLGIAQLLLGLLALPPLLG